MTNAHGARGSLAQLNTRGLHMFRDDAAWMSALGQKQTFSVGGTYSLMEMAKQAGRDAFDLYIAAIRRLNSEA